LVVILVSLTDLVYAYNVVYGPMEGISEPWLEHLSMTQSVESDGDCQNTNYSAQHGVVP